MASKPFPDKRRGEWVCKYRPDPVGPWKRVVLGKDPKIKKDHAPVKPPQSVLDRHREFTEIEYNAKHGIKPAPARAKGLAGYVASYLEAITGTMKAGSARQARRHAERFRDFVADKGVDSVQGVTRSLCRDYLEWRIREVSHDTLKTEMRYLMPIWSRAVEDGLMLVNPWAKLKVPGKSTRSAPVFWTNEEVARIAAACSKAWHTDLVMVLVNTGLRISTALALRWDWIDWRTGVVTIPREAAASADGVKTAYSLGLNRVARGILERRQFSKTKELVFPNPRGGGIVPYDSAREAISRAIRRAGVKTGTPHDLRHTYARMLDRSGAPASVVQSQLGHTSAATTRIYTDAGAEEAAKYLEDFGVGEVRSPEAEGTTRPVS